jgi:phosphate transport system permease protein
MGQGRGFSGSQARRQSLMDKAFKSATTFFALLVLVILGGVFVSLVQGSLPALGAFGFDFLATQVWNPVTGRFGAAAPIYGTVMTALIAMAVGIPISFGIAIFLTELAPPWLNRPVSIAIELLAGIPSIIYGIWGLFVFAPIFQQTLQPFLIDTIGEVPVLGSLFAGPPFGIGILTAALILGIMVLPFITSIMREVFETVPPMVKESAYGLGATTWEVVCKVVLPYTRVGVVGGVMLGLGRARRWR